VHAFTSEKTAGLAAANARALRASVAAAIEAADARRMSKIVIVGSSSIEFHSLSVPADVASAILAIISTTPSNAEIAIRASMAGNPKVAKRASKIEDLAAKIAAGSGRHAKAYFPGGVGRESTFNRDYALIDGADKVYAFFEAQNVMYGGTGHVVQAAIAKGVPVEAWEITEEELRLVGSDEGLGPQEPRMTLAQLERLYEEANK
jgi:hypothetical protein